ncbi:hypothetical protein PDQ77_17650 [Bacillus cereus]|uniref:hypothetical protein n=1 Tax=Bacillus cereus TaxID=1396 RepID=UPI0016432A99|nr:hypothetical protein [Bacillus cereus]MDA2648617.1 hypothetical protein [Bacillus cereus]
MNISKKYIHIALIWFLASLFCLQISYAIHTTTSITIGWILLASLQQESIALLSNAMLFL